MGRAPSDSPVLVDGVPAWMRSGLKAWLKPRVHYISEGRNLRWIARVRAFDQLTRRESPLSEVFEDYGFDALERELQEDVEGENLYIHFLDYLVYLVSGEYGGGARLEDLEEILRRSGSKWTVGTRAGNAGLEDRVSDGVREAAESVMALPGHAGELLAKAWHAAFGVSPNPVSAYTNAVLAVEAATVPVVIPSDRTATLGKVFAVMRDQSGWSLDIKKQHADFPADAVILGMVQMLWAGQGRHAGQPDWAPNTQAEAEAAVLLAVPLVQWFASGAIKRRV